MGKKISQILRGEITSSLFYVLLGLCLVLMPAQTVNIICKVVFGIVLAGAGLYHLYVYLKGKETSTILDLFTGVIVMVMGGFLFFNPLIVVKLLPLLLGAFILVDSIWKLKGAFQLKKKKRQEWQLFLFGSLIFIILGGVLIANPFMKTKTTVLVAGWGLLSNGAADFVFYFLLKRGLKGKVAKTEPEKLEDMPSEKDPIAWETEAEEPTVWEATPEEQTVWETEPEEPKIQENESGETAAKEPMVEETIAAEPVEEETCKQSKAGSSPIARFFEAEEEDDFLEEWKD